MKKNNLIKSIVIWLAVVTIIVLLVFIIKLAKTINHQNYEIISLKEEINSELPEKGKNNIPLLSENFNFQQENEENTNYDIIWNFQEHDFGEVEKNKKLSVEFTFTVISGTAQITGSRTYCSCTLPDWEPIKFLQNESYSITVEFDTKDKYGNFEETVDLFFNRNELPEKLTVKGRVKN